MDALERNSIEIARATPPEVKALQLLDLIDLGFRMKRTSLARRHATETSAEIDARFRLWLAEP